MSPHPRWQEEPTATGQAAPPPQKGWQQGGFHHSSPPSPCSRPGCPGPAGKQLENNHFPHLSACFCLLGIWWLSYGFFYYFYFSHMFRVGQEGSNLSFPYFFLNFKILSNYFPLPEPFLGFIYIPIIHYSIPDLDGDTWLTRSKVDPVQPVCQTKPLIHQPKSFYRRVMKESRTVCHSFLPMSLLTLETKTLLCLSAPPLPHPHEFSSWHSPA